MPSEHGRSYAEFLPVEALSAGVYELGAGAEDRQEPHSEDEVYVVLRGQAQATRRPNGRGLHRFALHVPAPVPHRFNDVEEDLAVLVLFAPPEGSRR